MNLQTERTASYSPKAHALLNVWLAWRPDLVDAPALVWIGRIGNRPMMEDSAVGWAASIAPH